MKEELERICIDLKAWCKKHNKEYVTMSYVEGSIMANLGTEDEDYSNCYIFIQDNEEEL